MIAGAEIDREALLCALVLAPFTFARNRFFALFVEPWARRTRSRAAQLRTVIHHFLQRNAGAELRELTLLEGGRTMLHYGVPSLRLERRALLEPLELALLRFALSRGRHGEPPRSLGPLSLTDDDRRQVEGALAKLGRRLGLENDFGRSPSPYQPNPTPGES